MAKDALLEKGAGSGDSTVSSLESNPTNSEPDVWALPDILDDEDDQAKWSDITHGRRFRILLTTFGRIVALLTLLFFFICSLDLLASAFRLLGGKTAGRVFRESDLLQNPVAGLMIGVLATVLLQSSSTSTSILVSMVAAEIIDVRSGIPIVMGANIGTSLTNTLVSVAHSGEAREFRRAFAGATVHDMFNWLSVIILLPVEIAAGYLYRVTGAIIGSLNLRNVDAREPPKLLSVITKPFTKMIVQLDKSIIKKVALKEIGDNETVDLIKHHCKGAQSTFLLTGSPNGTDNLTETVVHVEKQLCKHIFAGTSLDNAAVGLILLAVSLGALIFCLISIVKVLHSMLQGKVARVIRRTVNSDLPSPFSCLTGYLAIIVGALLTILLQSSSVFTSAMTPLVGVGVLSLERMFPLTLGANVGTTFTSILAAMASPRHTLGPALQLSLCHLFFNLTGILIFYPIPWMRKAPLGLAKMLGNKTAKYRWFVLLYILMMFLVVPGFVFALSLAGGMYLVAVGVPIVALVALVAAINAAQAVCPRCLPSFLRSWRWLPDWAHSLKPWDRWIGWTWDRLTSICPGCSGDSCGRFFPATETAMSVQAGKSWESKRALLKSASNSALPSRCSTPARLQRSLENDFPTGRSADSGLGSTIEKNTTNSLQTSLL